MAPSDAVRAAWALFLGLNQRVPRATSTDARVQQKNTNVASTGRGQTAANQWLRGSALVSSSAQSTVL